MTTYVHQLIKSYQRENQLKKKRSELRQSSTAPNTEELDNIERQLQLQVYRETTTTTDPYQETLLPTTPPPPPPHPPPPLLD
jgi:hypothetical protein